MTEPDIAGLAARAIAIAENAAKMHAEIIAQQAEDAKQRKEIVSQQAAIVKQQARSKRISRWLLVSLVLDIGITGGLWLNSVRTSDVQAASHASIINGCRLANVNRSQDIAVWNRLLRVPPGATPAQRAEAAVLERLVAKKDRPRNCVALYRK